MSHLDYYDGGRLVRVPVRTLTDDQANTMADLAHEGEEWCDVCEEWHYVP